MTKDIPNGYNGQVLRVDLTLKRVQPEKIGEEVCRKYLGGAGFIAYYLWNELKQGVDALSPENKIIFALGPISGFKIPGASRNCIGTKSPLSKGIAKSEVGGHWMAELKRAGFDAIIVEGRSEKPVFLWVHDGNAEIMDAGHLWGKETLETETIIRTELGDKKIQVAMIGPGGENMVRFACIMEGCHDAAGRGGMGAVMGSKNLKAIAVRGHTLPSIADEEKFREIRKQLSHPFPQSEYGTGGPSMLAQENTGDLPIRNFRDGTFPGVNKIHAGVIKDTIRVGMKGCFACHVKCKKVVKFDEPYRVDPEYGGPEYETLAALGSDCGIEDLKAIVKGNERCNAYSIDTISTGSTIAFAMECYEKGLLTKEDTGGLELKWGNSEAMLKAIELIARREGFGKILAEGTARMSKRFGKACQDFALHVKGLEPGMHEPRIGSALALGFTVSPTGADHCAAQPDGLLERDFFFKQYEPLGFLTPLKANDLGPKKVALFRLVQFQNILYDSLAACHFTGITFKQMAQLVEAVTGWDTGIPELLRTAERIVTLMRLFNLREGLSVKDDEMPERFFQPTTDGALANLKVDRSAYKKAVKYYYTLMGWDENGVPLPEKVEELF
ncbi:MAG: aldehyde ferredoxin oxidoreductase family protein [Deltaproteobacteria bacterium]|nr:aldehyde ferredoxin oxidoreductase family protein [Deltaproteobacteria bacterium]